MLQLGAVCMDTIPITSWSHGATFSFSTFGITHDVTRTDDAVHTQPRKWRDVISKSYHLFAHKKVDLVVRTSSLPSSALRIRRLESKMAKDIVADTVSSGEMQPQLTAEETGTESESSESPSNATKQPKKEKHAAKCSKCKTRHARRGTF